MIKQFAKISLPFLFSACSAGPILLEDLPKPPEPDSLKFLFAIKTVTAIPAGISPTGQTRMLTIPPHAGFTNPATGKIYLLDCKMMDRMISRGVLGLAYADAQDQTDKVKEAINALQVGHKSVGCRSIEV